MIINKFQGKTKEEAIAKAKEDFGPNAVIMNMREVKPKGIFRAFKNSLYEVTAAVDERENYMNAISSIVNQQKKTENNIDLAADEKIEIPRPVRSENDSLSKSFAKSFTMTQSQPSVQPKPTLASQQTASLQTSFEQKVMGQSSSALKPQTTLQSHSAQTTQSPFVHAEEKKIASVQDGKKEDVNVQMQKKLDDLSDILEQKLTNIADEITQEKQQSAEELNLIRMLYSILLKNEVHEKYVNQIMDEVEKVIRPGNSVDTILSNVYQKLILKFGQPRTIDVSGRKPNVIFFIGPTGVGKTTTIAKIASKYKVESNPKIAFITADTYRIAATEQLRVYANILDAPMSIVYSYEDLNEEVERYSDYDLIFVDTAGFSHKNEKQREDTKELLAGLSEEYKREVYLVLSATTKYRDLLDIVDVYHEISDYKLIFTKLDETSSYGNLLNIRLYADAELSYVTNGQNVPDDIEVFDTQKIVKQLLGGR